MTKNNSLLEPSFFEFHNQQCKFAIDVTNSAPNMPPEYFFKVCSVPHSDILFSFRPGKGLVRNATEDLPQEENLLGKLLAIEDEKFLEEIGNFCNANGFLFPIECNTYASYTIELLQEKIYRLRSTVNLMSAIGEKNSFEKILSNAAYLLLDEAVLQEESDGIASFSNLLNKASSLTELDKSHVTMHGDKLKVYDTLFKEYFEIDRETYDTIRAGDAIDNLQGSDTETFRKLFFLYFNEHNCSKELRQIIEFLFRFEYEFGVMKPFYSPYVNFYGTAKKYSDNKKYADALTIVAKSVLSLEINNNISNVTPVYSSEEMAPSWKISSLMQAMYFSLFYMKPGLQIFRKCGNPTCKRDHYFLVNTTALKKKYCCDECRNAANQRRLRDRKNKEH